MKNKMFKNKIFNLILILSCSYINLKAQIGIGVNSISSGKIIDFQDNCKDQLCTAENAKGIILPILTNTISNNFVNGTFLLDESEKIIKVYENDKWLRLSYLPGNLSNVITPTTSTEIGEGVYIGDNSNGNNSSLGVLELNSTDRALVLPKIYKPYISVENPYPGMICYDTDSKSLMLYDGRYWNIWKEKIIK
ncbi:hypothetical protein [Empedobacter falsenii]